jgi:predicted RNA-binding Zn ribbon-like protein
MAATDVTFQLVAGHVALDLANTLDYRFEPARRIDLIPAFGQFLDFCAQSGVISKADAKGLLARTEAPEAREAHRKAIRFREVADSMFRAIAKKKTPRAADLAELNKLLASRSIPEKVTRRGSSFEREFDDPAATADGPLWVILESAVQLLVSTEVRFVRSCKEKSCQWLFIDSSKSHSRRWCSMEICGNRNKSQRYRDRLASGS